MTLNTIMVLLLVIAFIATEVLTMRKYLKLYKEATSDMAREYIHNTMIMPEARYITLISTIILTVALFNNADAYFISLIVTALAFTVYMILGHKYAEDKEKSKLILIVMLFINSYSIFFKEHTTVASESMMPEFEVGQYVSISKNHYGVKIPVIDKYIIKGNEPEVGDVVVFKNPLNQSEYYVKRVVALSGDTIEYKNKSIALNGKFFKKLEASEKYEVEGVVSYIEVDPNKNKYTVLNTIESDPLYPDDASFDGLEEHCEIYNSEGFKCTVPENHYFMMGDNRDNSYDSRYFGFISKDKIIGKVK